jgi:hypothetical protein
VARSPIAPDIRSDLESHLGTGERLGRAEYEDESGGVVLLVEIEGQYMAPIVEHHEPTPDAPAGPIERLETRAATLEDAVADAKCMLRNRVGRTGPVRGG